MKTVFAPDTAPAYLEIIQTFFQNDPVFAFAGVVVLTGFAAKYLANRF